MRTIWKFPIRMVEDFAITMPAGAEVLSVEVQRGAPVMAALVDDSEAITNEARRFAVHCTGDPVPRDRGRHLGSFQLHRGALMLHVFEVRPSG